ncbi:MAG TPA: metal ABC transporter permease [Chloroflexia bacterium]|nr:metal ABC transporter permease [Chloroflexia bacterium]
MDLIDLITNLFTDYTVRTIALGSAVLGIVSGALGAYAVLRKQSLLGDAMSHAALPGIAIGFLLTGSKSPLVLGIGAAIAGWLATLLVMTIVRDTRIKQDTALGLALSVFFGFGLMLLTFIQKMPNAAQAGLDKFLFGQAAALVEEDVIVMAVVAAIALAAVMVFWKEFKILSFDPDFGATLGYRIRAIDVLLTTLLVMAIVIGLQTVGVVLMSAMIVAPAVAARQWTDRLGVMVALSALFGALAGVAGAFWSSSTERLPTGPAIVVCISAIAILSLLFAPNRGIVWSRIAAIGHRRRIRTDTVLGDMYALARHHEGHEQEHGHTAAVLQAMSYGSTGIDATLADLEQRGLVQRNAGDEWSLTAAGLDEARSRHPDPDGPMPDLAHEHT